MPHTNSYLASATSIDLLRRAAQREVERDPDRTVSIHHHTAELPCENFEHEFFGMGEAE